MPTLVTFLPLPLTLFSSLRLLTTHSDSPSRRVSQESHLVTSWAAPRNCCSALTPGQGPECFLNLGLPPMSTTGTASTIWSLK